MSNHIFTNRLGGILILIFTALSVIIYQGCKDSSTNPPEEKPPGYQEDIVWPSLADSPWPMLDHDPQRTGRSKNAGPQFGVIEWIYEEQSEYITSSTSIGADSIIYTAYNKGLKAINPDGLLKWKNFTNTYSTSATPIILSNGDIIHFTSTGVYCVTADNIEKWFFKVNISGHGNCLGKEGTIYFISGGTLYALSENGELQWEIYDQYLTQVNHMSISPDSKILYLTGNPALIAFNLQAKTINWKFGRTGTNWSVVDSYGNIYITASVDSINNGKGTLFSLHADGSIRWSREHTSWSQIGNQIILSLARPTIDKWGNLYYASDSVYSLDFNGKLRWSKKAGDDQKLYTTPLVCDNQGNIYVIKEGNEVSDLFSFNKDGFQRFSILNLPDYTGTSPAILNESIIIPAGNNIRVFKIK